VDTPAPSRMILRGGVVRGEGMGKEGGGQMGIRTGSGDGPGEAHQGGPGQGNANGRAEAHQHQNPGRAEMTAGPGASSSGSIMGLGGSPQPQTPSRSKSKSRRPSQSQSQSPYANGSATASASTPNLASPPASASASASGLLHQGPLPPLPTSPSPIARSNSINPSSGGNGNGSGTGPSQSQSQSQMTPASPIRKRWSPPSGLPPVRSDSPDESVSASASGKAGGRGSPVVVRAVSVADRDRRGPSPSPSPSPSPLRPALGQRPRTPLKPKDRSASGSGGSGSTSGLDTRERWRVLAAAAAASASVDDDGDDTESMGMGMVMEVGADRDSPTGSGSGNDAEVKPLPVPQLMNPPPKSVMRKPSLKKLDNSGLFNWARSAASPGSNSGMRERRGSMKSREDSTRPPETPSKAGVGSKKTGKGHSANVDYDSDRNLSLRDSVGELPHLRRGGGGAHHGHSNSTGNLNLNLGMYSSSSNNSPYSPSHSNNPYSNNYPYRQSVASTAPSDADTTVTTAISSILDGGRSSSGGGGMFGTIRTMTTDLTSEAPSMSRTEGSFLAEEMARKRSIENGLGNGNGNASGWDRKLSVLDLSRVAEERETDESVSSKGHNGKDRARGRAAEKEKEKPAASSPAVHLRKGKWPDDFMDVFQNSSQAQPIPSKHSSIDYLDDRDSSRQSTPISISPPRKLAIVGHRRSDGENSSGGAAGPAISGSPTSGLQFPRRPTHRPRHTIDTPVLLPKESLLRREASPDGSTSSSARVMLRRHSTKPNLVGVGRPHGYGRTSSSNLDEAPPTPTSDSASDRPAMVPFPRSASGEHGSPSPRSSGGEGMPRLRGRFQSEVDGASSRRRARPSSYDELGAKPPRSRIESMVNLGVASSGATSASDLLSRDSVDGSVVRMRLVVREDGKPPTHFVST